MDFLAQLRSAFAWATGSSTYDAVVPRGKRRNPTGILRREDDELRPGDRKKALSAVNTLNRNSAAAAWAIRKHLDYISTFTFQARCENEALNNKLETLVETRSRPENFEVTGRYSRQRFIRMAEMRRTLDGDMGVAKIYNGRVQAIEGDCIRTPDSGLPTGYTAADFLHGVRTNRIGRPLEYCVCRRGASNDSVSGGTRFEFERLVNARNMMHFGYFDRFDQVRGISPLITAVNVFQDVYEGIDYALARMKVAQMFGLVFYRERGDEGPTVGPAEQETETGGYKVSLDRGPFSLELDPGDRAEFLENKTPSNEFQNFSQVVIAIALKSLDIPYSFFNESFTNYSGARQAMLQYEASASIKQKDVRELLDRWLEWQLFIWALDGELPGVDLASVNWDWIPNGMSWIDPLKEVSADIAALGAGLTSRTRLLRQRGEDVQEVARELAAEKKLFEDNWLTVGVNPVNAQILEIAQ